MDGRPRTWPGDPPTFRQRDRAARLGAADKGATTFDFTQQTFPSTLTFTRSSSASYITSAGVVATAPANTPRFEYLGGMSHLLVEGSATNLLNGSASFATAGGTQNNWTDLNITRSTGGNDPSGAANVVRVTSTATSATIINSQVFGLLERTFSIWLRRVTGTGNIQLTGDNGATWTTVTITATWARYSITTTATHQVGILIAANGDAIEIWGAQLEDGAIPTSYVATTTTTITRSADGAITNNWTSGSNRWKQWNTAEGTLLIEAAHLSRNLSGTYPRPVNFVDGTNLVQFGSYLDTDTSPDTYGIEVRTDSGLLSTTYGLTFGSMFKHVMTAYTATGVAIATIDHAAKGISQSSGTASLQTTTMPAVNMVINYANNGGLGIMRLRRIMYWPYKMSASRIRDLSAD